MSRVSVGSFSLLFSTHRISVLRENKGRAQGKSLAPNKKRDTLKCSKTNGCPAFTSGSNFSRAERSWQRTTGLLNPRVPFKL